MTLRDLGYTSCIDDLDADTATCLIAIKNEITKQENETREKSIKKGRGKSGR